MKLFAIGMLICLAFPATAGTDPSTMKCTSTVIVGGIQVCIQHPRDKPPILEKQAFWCSPRRAGGTSYYC